MAANAPNRAAKEFTHISCTFGMMPTAFGPVLPANDLRLQKKGPPRPSGNLQHPQACTIPSTTALQQHAEEKRLQGIRFTCLTPFQDGCEL